MTAPRAAAAAWAFTTAALALAACEGDAGPGGAPDAGTDVRPNEAGPAPNADADADMAPGPPDATCDAPSGTDADATDDSPDGRAPRWLLLAGVDFVGGASELLAYDVANERPGGALALASTDPVVVASGGDVWVLERDADRVTRLDRAAPWIPRASWSVRLADAPDGGRASAMPVVVIAGPPGKAYVLRAARNAVAVLDATGAPDAGAPVRTVDLAAALDPADGDGAVDAVAAAYHPGRRLLYVALQRVDRTRVVPPALEPLCGAAPSVLVAIDVDGDTLVDLNGGAPGVALPLLGMNPVALAFDPPRDRLLLAHAGCRDATDGGAAPARGRAIEELSLFTHESRTLLDATALGYPSRFVFIDERRALLRFVEDGTVTQRTFVWDPTSPAIGREVPSPDAFAWDGDGRLVGVERQFDHDGGDDWLDVVSVRLADGRKRTLGTAAFSPPRARFVPSSLLGP